VFIDHVKAARGARLSGDDGLFTGAFWTGARAETLGLIDGIGHLVPVMKREFGDKVRFAVYGPRRSMLKRFGAALAGDALAAVEERALWARFGL
jgi:serine protease SohB